MSNSSDLENLDSDSLIALHVHATIFCDGERICQTTIRCASSDETVGELKRELKERLHYFFSETESARDFFCSKFNWSFWDKEQEKEVVYELDDESMSLSYLCQFADHLQVSKWVGNTCIVSNFTITCFYKNNPEPTLVEKVLSLALRKLPRSLLQDYNEFLAHHPNMQRNRRKLTHFASSETNFEGIELPQRSLSDLIIFKDDPSAVVYEDHLQSFNSLGATSSGAKFKLTAEPTLSSDVHDNLRFSLNGIERLGSSDNSANIDRFGYLEASLFFGVLSSHNGATNDDLLNQPYWKRWYLSKILRSPVWDLSKQSNNSNEIKWDIDFKLPLSQIPLQTRLCITLNLISQRSVNSKNSHKFFFELNNDVVALSNCTTSFYENDVTYRNDVILESYVILPLFNSQGYLNKRWKNLFLWPFPTNENHVNILHSPIGSIYRPMGSEFDPSNEIKSRISSIQFTCSTHGVDDKSRIKYSVGCTKLDKSTTSNNEGRLSGNALATALLISGESTNSVIAPKSDKDVVTTLRKMLKRFNWANKAEVDKLDTMLDQVEKSYNNAEEEGEGKRPSLPIELCLDLLTYKNLHQRVRDFAVKNLINTNKKTIQYLMSALVQALKFENSVDTELVRFLFRETLASNENGYKFCWYLLVECENPQYRGFYLVLLETFLKNCKPKICNLFLKSLLCDREMSQWAAAVQQSYGKYSPEAAHYSLTRNISTFEGQPVPYESSSSCFYANVVNNVANVDSKETLVLKNSIGSTPDGEEDTQYNVSDSSPIGFKVPLCNLYNPFDKMESIDKNKCKIMNSKKLPLWITMRRVKPRSRSRSFSDRSPSRRASSRSLSRRDGSSRDAVNKDGLSEDTNIVKNEEENETEVAVKRSEDRADDDSVFPEIKMTSVAPPMKRNSSLTDDMSLAFSPVSRETNKQNQSFIVMDSLSPLSRRKRSQKSITSSDKNKKGKDRFSLSVFNMETHGDGFLQVFNHFERRKLSIYELRWSQKTFRSDTVQSGRSKMSTLHKETLSEDISSDVDVIEEESGDTVSEINEHPQLMMDHVDPVDFIEDSLNFIVIKPPRKISQPQGRRDALSALPNIDKFNDKYRDCEMIYKAGDDLRQDVLIMQIFDLMNHIWSQHESTRHVIVKTYGCIATSQNTGAIEVVQDAITLCRTQKIYNDRLNRSKTYWDRDSLKKWLEDKNDPKNWYKVEDNFFWSALGSCVATFILGIGDRHSDNMMIQEDGTFLHIDFGHMLGNFKKFKMIARETTPFFFTPDIVEVLGGPESPDYVKFKTYFVTAYCVLRDQSHLFLSLFNLMLGAGLPELRFPEHINYMREKTLLIDRRDDRSWVDVAETDTDGGDDSSMTVNTSFNTLDDRVVQSKIIGIFDAAASNQRQIWNQRIHQLK